MHSLAAFQMNVIIGSWTVTRFIIYIVPLVSVEGCLKGKRIPSGLPITWVWHHRSNLKIQLFVDRLPEDGHQMCDNETPRMGKAALRLIGPSIGLLFFLSSVPIRGDEQSKNAQRAGKTTLVF